MQNTYLTFLQALPNKQLFLDSSKNSHNEDVSLLLTDTLFLVMAPYWQRGDYHQVITLADNAAPCQLVDIRCCVYYLYALWVTNSKRKLCALLNVIACVFVHPNCVLLYKDNVAPLYHCTRIFCSKLRRRLQRNTTTLTLTNDEVGGVLSAFSVLNDIFVEHYSSADLSALTKPVIDYYQQYRVALQKECEGSVGEKSIEGEHEPDALAIPVEEQLSNENEPTTRVEKKDCLYPQQIFTELSDGQKPYVDSSSVLALLLEKMTHFESLLGEDQTLKAAIILNEIQCELDSFNPVIYFPKLFSRFATAHAVHCEQLEPALHMHGSTQWETLRRLYQVDKSAFDNFKIIGEESFDHYEGSVMNTAPKRDEDFLHQGENGYEN